MAYVAGEGDRAGWRGVAGPPRQLARSLQVGGHGVRDPELQGVHSAEMPGPGRGRFGVDSSFLWEIPLEENNFGRDVVWCAGKDDFHSFAVSEPLSPHPSVATGCRPRSVGQRSSPS